jgi:hypothetical protein
LVDATNRAKEKTLAILERVFADYPTRDFAVRLWDTTTWPEGGGSSLAFTLVLNHPGALRKMFLPGLAAVYVWVGLWLRVRPAQCLSDVAGQAWSRWRERPAAYP